MKMEGFDELQKRLKQIEKGAQELHGTNEVPLQELLTDAFLAKHSKFSSFEEFADSSIFSEYDSFEEIPDSEFDQFVKENTNFNDWEEMSSKAGAEYVSKKLGF